MGKQRSHLRTTTITSTVNEDGELMEEKRHSYLASSKEEFMLVYTSLWGQFQEMSLPEVKLYSHLLERYNAGVDIGINKALKKRIAETLNLNIRTVENTLSKLVEKSLIYRVDTALYKLNPRYAFRGSSSNRNGMLKFILEVECPTC